MGSANVKWVQKVHCFVWWGCAWVRLVPLLELWGACIYADPALFCEVGREIEPKSVYKCLWWVRMWNECNKCTVLYGWDVPEFHWYHTWNCGVRVYMLVRHLFVKGVKKKFPNRCIGAYSECECEMSAKRALFLLWGCAWVRLLPHLKLWGACIYAGTALFCEEVREIFAKSVLI